MSATVMYMGPTLTHPTVHHKILAWPYFLEEALRPAGVVDVTKLSHNMVRWDNSVVFFDRAGALDGWEEMVRHLLLQNNVAVIVSDDLMGDLLARHNKKSGVRPALLLSRTWEAEAVRRIFAQAQEALTEIAGAKAKEET